MYGSVSFALARAKLFITRAEYFRGSRAKSTRVVSGADAVWCADRNDQGHGRRRTRSGGSRLLRRGLLLRDGGAYPLHRQRVAGCDFDTDLGDQLLHAPDPDGRPGHESRALRHPLHRALLRKVQGGGQADRVRAHAAPGADVAERGAYV